ncbi:MAG: TfoX/Sxy family protein [Cellulomonas sp.]
MSPHDTARAASTSPDRRPPGPARQDAHRDDLVQRVRAVLAGRDVREVQMFGGVSFMVDGTMAVAARRDGDLLVRIDPARHDQLRQVPGARGATMGTGRSMGPGWISVERSHLGTGDELSFWTRTALECRRRVMPQAARSHPRKVAEIVRVSDRRYRAKGQPLL